MQAAVPTASRRLKYLDALRGLAAVWVVVYHSSAMKDMGVEVPAWAQSVVHYGGMGVTLFFIVSAFSLCLTMPRHLKHARPLVSFYGHRFFRIAPLFYFWILVTYLRDIFVFDAYHSLRQVAGSAFFLFNFVPGAQEGFVWASWTIGVEMVFYASFPFIYGRVKSLADALAWYFGAILLFTCFRFVILNYTNIPEQSFLVHTVIRHLPTFMAGMVAFYALAWLNERNLKAWGPCAWALGLLLYSLSLVGKPDIFIDSYFNQSFVFGSIFLGCALTPYAFVVNRLTEFLGKISYSLYLLHPSLIFALSHIFKRVAKLEMPLSVRFSICMVILLGTAIPISYLTYLLIEMPGIRLGRKLLDGRRAESGSASVGTAPVVS